MKNPWPPNHPAQLDASALAALGEIVVFAAHVVALVAQPLLAETLDAPAALVALQDVLFDAFVAAARKAGLVAAQHVCVGRLDALAVHAKPAALAALNALDAPVAGVLDVPEVLLAFEAPGAAARMAALVVAQPVLGEVLDVPEVLLAFEAPGAAARMAALVVAQPVLGEVLDVPEVLLAFEALAAAASMAALIAPHPVLVE